MHYNPITQLCETESHRHDPSSTEKGSCFELARAVHLEPLGNHGRPEGPEA